jgi:hypothetical protein
MLTALALLVAMPPVSAADLPAGTNRAMQHAVLQVQEHLSEGRFEEAATAAGNLPERHIRVGWDDRKVPAAFRRGFAEQRDLALEAWRKAWPALSFEIVPGKPAVTFTFEPLLAPRPDTGMPYGAALFYGDRAEGARLEVVLGLQRGEPPREASGFDVYNEVLHGIGAYLGLETNPMFGTAMGRTDLVASRNQIVAPAEVATAQRILAAADALRASVAKRERVEITRPEAFIDPPHGFVGTKARQGDDVEYALQLTNNGRAPLHYRFTVDCGCIKPIRGGAIEPGGTQVVPIRIDTVHFTGHLDKKVFLFTNDPEMPVRTIPVVLDVEPIFQFSMNGGDAIVLPVRGPRTAEVLLEIDETSGIRLLDAAFAGIDVEMRQEPWQGIGASGRPAKGLRFVIQFPDVLPLGRSNGTLSVMTNHPLFRTLQHNLTVQSGIVALPEAVFLGEISRVPTSARLFVNRPGQPFRVVGIETSSPHLRASFTSEGPLDEHRIDVAIDGAQPSGEFAEEIKIRTDDPDQPTLVVPILAKVR